MTARSEARGWLDAAMEVAVLAFSVGIGSAMVYGLWSWVLGPARACGVP